MSNGEETKPRLIAPPGTCDCHMHVYHPRYKSRSDVAKPPVAPLKDYLRVRARLGITRSVVVQPVAYGTDNSCTLEAIAGMGGSARGVAVVDRSVTDADLEDLTRRGIRGIRFQMFPGGVLPWEALDELAARVHAFGWHVQLQMDGCLLPEREAQLRRLPGLLVIDHVGKFLEPVPVDHASFRTLLGLVDTGRVYVKLSAPYEVSKVGAPSYADVGALARALVQAAPERMVWATNWPHPSAPAGRMPDDANLLDLLLDWAPDEQVRHKILVENPARLYGF